VPLREVAPAVDAEVAAIVHRCLEREPDRRFPTAEALFDALVPLIGERRMIHVDELVALDRGPEAEAASAAHAEAPVPDLGVTAPMAPAEAPTEGLAETVAAAPAVGGVAAPRSSASGAISPRAERAGGPRMAWLVGAGALVAAAAGWFALRGTAPAAPVDSTGRVASAESSAHDPTSADPAAEGKSPAVRNVQVVVIPSDASVEVDGKPAELRGSLLTLTGPVGTVFEVRVHQGGAETIADVVISNAGAVPPKLELVPGQVVRMPRGGASSSAPAATSKTAPTGEPGSGPKPPRTRAADRPRLDPDMREVQ
jgi:serine/threonine-protein kinase